MSSSVLRMIVVGGGTAGWMAASLMNRRWGERVRIQVVESPDIGIIGVGEGSTPQLKAFFDTLDIAEADWMPACQATYKAGIEFRHWSTRPGFERYFHPFSTEVDDRTAPALYFNSFVRRKGADVVGHPDPYFLATELARQQLAPLPAWQFPFAAHYGYHFDSTRIGQVLRRHATERGIEHIEATVSEVLQDPDGNIQALCCSDGRRIEGDFFVDSTGFRSLLLQQSLRVPFVSFADNLYNDSAVVVQTPREPGPIAPQTISTALGHGWVWRIPLTERIGNGYVYSSRHVDREQAEAEFRAHLQLPEAASVRHLSMKVGRVAEHWSHNCLAVGLSQGFIEPLEATALHLVQETVERFIESFEAGGFAATHRQIFNDTINHRFEGVRDYIVCHYRINSRSDTEYWRENARNECLSDSLKRVLHTWYSGEDLLPEIERQQLSRYYGAASWHCILAGYGLFPAAAQLAPPTDKALRFDMGRIRQFIERCALNFRPHHEVLAEMGQHQDVR